MAEIKNIEGFKYECTKCGTVHLVLPKYGYGGVTLKFPKKCSECGEFYENVDREGALRN